MKAKLTGSYRNANGTLVFRHEVTGTTEELAAYKAAQGEYYRESDSGVPLWFSTRTHGNVVELKIAQKSGNVFADTSEMDAAANMVAQYGGNFGQELAKSLVAKLTSNMGRVSQASANQAVEKTEETAGKADLEQA